MGFYTKDEKYIAAGVGGSAGVSGIGILLFYAALSEPSMLGYLTDMFLGSTLFISGFVGVVGFCSIFYNYRAIL